MGIEDTDGSFRIDPETGKIKKEGVLSEWDTGYRIDKETGKIKKEGVLSEWDTGVRVEKESGRVVEDKGLCLITTACVRAMHLPDDSTELKVLRNFRDTYVRSFPHGDELISEYYSIAPHIVKAIDAEANAHEIYAQLYKQLVLKTVELIKAGKYEEAFANCFTIITDLKRRYL